MKPNSRPFCLRQEGGQDPEWYCMVSGRIFGPWDNIGACLAGYETEIRRVARERTND